MEKTAKTIKLRKASKKEWIDPEGNVIPAKYVTDDMKLQEFLMEFTERRVTQISAIIQQHKADIDNLLMNYLDGFAKAEADQDKWKGGVTLYSFDGTFKMERNFTEYIDFDKNMQLALQKIDQCFSEKLEGLEPGLIALIRSYFKPNKKGQLNLTAIRKVRSYNIDSEAWKEAVRLIDNGFKVASTKFYLKFYKKDDKGNWNPVNVNFSQF